MDKNLDRLCRRVSRLSLDDTTKERKRGIAAAKIRQKYQRIVTREQGQRDLTIRIGNLENKTTPPARTRTRWNKPQPLLSLRLKPKPRPLLNIRVTPTPELLNQIQQTKRELKVRRLKCQQPGPTRRQESSCKRGRRSRVTCTRPSRARTTEPAARTPRSRRARST